MNSTSGVGTDTTSGGGSHRASTTSGVWTATEIHVGGFELQYVLGRGGMGTVWAALHRARGVPAAVKVLNAAQFGYPRCRASLANEVRSVARMRHPAVVEILDMGVIDEAAQEASDGRLTANSPYLVMERVSGGTLSSRPPRGWAALKDALLQVLSGLAHAHARGLVHRDLKPSNVLLAAPDDLRSGLRVTDWGLAHALDADEDAEAEALGTLKYMAPEQILGHIRDQGPWTDLYGLGCLAWAITTGSAPFDGTSPGALARKHLEAHLPVLEPTFPVPRGFEDWLGTLLAKEPVDRVQLAPDAALGLMELGDTADSWAGTETWTGSLEMDPLSSRETPAWGHRLDPKGLIRADATPLDRIEPVAAWPPGPTPPIPLDWRPDPEASLSMIPEGTGLGLFGVRRIPLVGRDPQRDRIWSQLKGVADDGRARAVLVEGPPGIGKSRLAEWVCHRAAELGAARYVCASHGAGATSLGGLSSMVASLLRSYGLPRSEVLTRARTRLGHQGEVDAWEAAALTEVVCPATPADLDEDALVVRFARPAERYSLLRRQLQRESLDRPLILWLDDIHLSPDSAAFVEALLDAQAHAPAPILVLMTATSAPSIGDARDIEELRDLRARADCDVQRLQGLSTTDQRRLVEELLGLQPALAAQVGERVEGTPLFAVQLVGDLVQRGVLRAGDRGFELAHGERLSLPDDIHMLLIDRVDEVLRGLPEGCRRAVELGAVLGRWIDSEEWKEACYRAITPLPMTLLERMLHQRLLVRTEFGWMLTSELLRESILRSAEHRGRLAEHHRLVSDVLRGVQPAGTPRLAERVGEHLFAGAAWEPAVEALLIATEERWERGESQTARQLLRRREEALVSAGVPEADRRWGEGQVLLARILGHLTEFSKVRALAEEVLGRATAEGWADLAPEAMRTLAFAEWQLGERQRSEELYSDALGRFEALRRPRGVGRCQLGLGIAAAQRGETAEAEERFSRGVAAFEQADDARGLADALGWLGIVANRRGDPERATAWYARALPEAERIGHRLGAAMIRNSMAVLARQAGDLAEAEAGFKTSLAIATSIGTGEAVWPRVNLGLMLLEQRRAREASGCFRRCVRELRGRGRDELLGLVHVALVACAASAEDWEAWDLHMEEAEPLVKPGSPMMAADLAGPAATAAERAELAGKLERARALRALVGIDS